MTPLYFFYPVSPAIINPDYLMRLVPSIDKNSIFVHYYF
jgi:hypothetical protein